MRGVSLSGADVLNGMSLRVVAPGAHVMPAEILDAVRHLPQAHHATAFASMHHAVVQGCQHANVTSCTVQTGMAHGVLHSDVVHSVHTLHDSSGELLGHASPQTLHEAALRVQQHVTPSVSHEMADPARGMSFSI